MCLKTSLLTIMSFKYIVPFPLLSKDVTADDVIGFYKPFRDSISYVYLDLPFLNHFDYCCQQLFEEEYLNFIENGTEYFDVLLVVNPISSNNSVFSIKKFFNDLLKPILLKYKIAAVFSFSLELLFLIKETFPSVSLFYRYTSNVPWSKYFFWKRYIGIENLIASGDKFYEQKDLQMSSFNLSFVSNEYCFDFCPKASFRIKGVIDPLGFCKSCVFDSKKYFIRTLLKPSVFINCDNNFQVFLSGFHQPFSWIKGLCCCYFFENDCNFMRYINYSVTEL